MKKDDVLKFVVGVLLLTLVLAFSAGEATANTLYEKISAVIAVALVVAVISLGAERGSELLKIVLRFAFGSFDFLKSWQPTGAGSVLIAGIVSYAGVQKFDVDILSQFPLFAAVDPQLVSYITVALLWIGSSLWHNALPPNTGKAQALK